MNGKMLLVFAVLFLLFLIPYAQAYTYTGNTFNSDNSASPLAIAPSFYPLGSPTCLVRLSDTVTLIGSGTYGLTLTHYSPDDTILGSGVYSLMNNVTCVPLAVDTTTNNYNGKYEAKANLVHGATSGFMTLKSELECNTSSQWLTFELNATDSRGWFAGSYFYTECLQGYTQTPTSTLKTFMQSSNFGECVQKSPYISLASNGINPLMSCVIPQSMIKTFSVFQYIPVSTEEAGLINISILPPIWNATGNSYLYHTSYEVATYYLDDISSYSTRCSSLPCDIQISVDGNKTLIIFMKYQMDGAGYLGGATWYFLNPIGNISINVYEPTWICGDWTECTGGTKTRVCVDQAGILPNKYESQACYTAPEESIFMGFEDYYSQSAFYCYEDFFFGCRDNLATKSVKYPTDWSIGHSSDPYPVVPLTDNVTAQTGMLSDNIKMTTEEAKDSQYSLKMWYLPPEARIPYNNYPLSPPSNTVVTCINASYGSQPAIYNEWNQSIFIARNITFPSPFMTLSFDTLKCKDNKIEKKFAPPFFFIPLCGRTDPECCCYSYNESCTRNIEDTSMLFRVRDSANFSSPNLDVTFQVTDALNWKHHEYQIDNLQTNKTYQIAIELTTDGIQDSNDYCAYVDNVNLNTRNMPVVCESYCEGVTRHEATCKGYVGSDCTLCDFTEVEVSPYCVSEPDKVLSCVNWCDCAVGNGTLYNASSTSYGCAWTVYPNNPSCHTECAQQAEESNLYTPYINATAFGAGNEWVAGFFTPILISLIIAIGISAVIVFKIPAVGWQGFIITFYGLLLVFSLVGLFPAWVYIVMIVFAGLIFASKFAGTVFQ